MRWGWSLLILFVGCTDGGSDARDDAQDRVAELRAALPAAESMTILMPGAVAPAAEHALFYTFTRSTTHSVNALVRGVGRTVEDIVDRAPSETDRSSFAQWGPWTDALAPVTYTVRVDREGERFTYAVTGWPKGRPDAATVVLEGEARPGEGAGRWRYDLTATHAMNPIAQPSRGVVEVAFSVGARRALEVTFTDVEWPHEPTPTTTLYRYTADADGAGTFDYVSNLDIHADDDPELDRRELLQVRSRWLAEGPGRADVVASGGDVAEGVEVEMVQCWSADFRETHTRFESRAGEWGDGDATACPFAAAERPEFADFDPTDFEDDDLIDALPTVGDFSLGLAPIRDPVPEGEQAGYYRMTVGVLFSLQVQVSSVLGTLRNITRLPASRCDAGGCAWGPWTDWNSGLSWRLDVRREGDDSFSYTLGVKYFGEPADAVRTVIRGGYVDGDGADGQGWFRYDNRALHEIDPEEHGTDAVRAEYARLGIGAALAMRVDDEDGQEKGRYHVSVVNQAGTLDARFQTDMDNNRPGRTALETIEARIRWLSDASGTGNVLAHGGNLSGSVAAVECWDARARLTHDAVSIRGGDQDTVPFVDPDECVHSDFQEPEFRPLGDEE